MPLILQQGKSSSEQLIIFHAVLRLRFVIPVTAQPPPPESIYFEDVSEKEDWNHCGSTRHSGSCTGDARQYANQSYGYRMRQESFGR